MIRIDKNHVDLLRLQISRKREPVVPRRFTPYDDLLGSSDYLVASQILQKTLKAFLTVAETKHFL